MNESITKIAQLEDCYGTPHEIVKNKAVYQIDPYTQKFIEHSPFVILSSCDSEGFMDTSPRGGEPGFVKVLDETTLLIPNSAGNRRLDTFRNLLSHPQIGLMFMIPGIEEIVRVKGYASLHSDPELCAKAPDGNRVPKMVVKVIVKELFFHCPKAIMISKLWQPDNVTDRAFLPSLGDIVTEQQRLKEQSHNS